MIVSLKNIIAPHYYKIFWDIQKNKHTHYKLYGGRGSLKSSFISIMIIYGMMNDSNANAVVFRKVKDTLQESVFEQLIWAIDILGVSDKWDIKMSPLRLTYKPTKQRIIFRGCDDPNKAKSVKLRKGYFKFIWFEERAEFEGEEDERTILQSLMRGGPKFVVFYSWNPPKSINSWVNQDVLIPREDTLCDCSTYLEAPREWLGEQFFIEAAELKRRKPMAYKNEYLGIPTGTGGKVFDNVTIRVITEEERSMFDKIKQGLDFGYAADPLAFERMHYNKKNRRLFIFGEVYKVNLSNRAAVKEIKALNPENSYINADSEEPRAIASFNELGLRLIAAKKGPGSVDHGMHFLSQDIDEIIIDPITAPNAAREFGSYELERDKNGNFKGGYPDKNNHAIDAVRYALEDDMTVRKAKIKNKRALIGA